MSVGGTFWMPLVNILTHILDFEIFKEKSNIWFIFVAVKKPFFHDALKNVSVPEGKMVRMECKFSGEPKPQIQWVRGNTPIMASAVFKVSHVKTVGNRVSLKCKFFREPKGWGNPYYVQFNNHGLLIGDQSKQGDRAFMKTLADKHESWNRN